ncbi:unnamed protein product, partial [Prorocentrum cordatum]
APCEPAPPAAAGAAAPRQEEALQPGLLCPRVGSEAPHESAAPAASQADVQQPGGPPNWSGTGAPPPRREFEGASEEPGAGPPDAGPPEEEKRPRRRRPRAGDL